MLWIFLLLQFDLVGVLDTSRQYAKGFCRALGHRDTLEDHKGFPANRRGKHSGSQGLQSVLQILALIRSYGQY
jgi:hypothetical protein